LPRVDSAPAVSRGIHRDGLGSRASARKRSSPSLRKNP
jgi:hypothetical protein